MLDTSASTGSQGFKEISSALVDQEVIQGHVELENLDFDWKKKTTSWD